MILSPRGLSHVRFHVFKTYFDDVILELTKDGAEGGRDKEEIRQNVEQGQAERFRESFHERLKGPLLMQSIIFESSQANTSMED